MKFTNSGNEGCKAIIATLIVVMVVALFILFWSVVGGIDGFIWVAFAIVVVVTVIYKGIKGE